MGGTQCVIHPEAKLLSSCETVKPDKLSDSKLQWCDRHNIEIPIPKGGNWKEERDDGFQASPEPSKANSTGP